MLFQGRRSWKGRTADRKTGARRASEKRIRKNERKDPHRRLFPAWAARPWEGRTGRASLRALREKWARASLSVETALALPLFFLGMITLISFMDLYRLQTERLTRLCERAKEAGMYAYGAGEGEKEDITLPDVYAYRPIGGLAPLPPVWIHSQVTVRAWTGKERRSGGREDDGPQERMVYVTENGEVYHRTMDCTYLRLTVTQVPGASVASLRNAYGEKYHACEACSQGQRAGPVVYITEKGNRYHNLAACSGLKRTVHLVRESETGKLRPCPRCG